MPRTADALVRPEMLRWARDTSGLDVGAAAKRAQVRPHRVEEWERGDARPTVAQLRKLAMAYRRPLGAFYLPVPPAPLPELHDFRRATTAMRPLSPELRLAHREAVYRRDLALELIAEIGEEAPMFRVAAHTSDDPEHIGARIRGQLGVTPDQQAGWAGQRGALNAWRTLCEDAGVLVCQAAGVPPDEMSGFSIAQFPLPVVVLNNKDLPQRRSFTLLHEMVHLATKEGGLCELHGGPDEAGQEWTVEVFCNQVAGATLVPLDDLVGQDAVRERGRSEGWSDEELSALAGRYKTSREVVLRRLLTAELTTLDFYRQKREEFHRQYRQANHKAATGGPDPSQLAISKTGRRFAELVLRAYHLERVTASDVAQYLGLRVKHIPEVEIGVFGPESRRPGG